MKTSFFFTFHYLFQDIRCCSAQIAIDVNLNHISSGCKITFTFFPMQTQILFIAIIIHFN